MTLAAAGGDWAGGAGWVALGLRYSCQRGGGGVRVWRAPSLTSVRETGCGLGGMMIDGVACRMCGRASLLGPSVPGAGWRQDSFGASATVWATVHRLRADCRFGPRCRSPCGGDGGPGPVAEAAQDVVGAAGELAGDGQGGAVGVDPGGDIGVVAVVGGGGA